MSLTLQLEDEKPDLFVTKIMCHLQPHELVYQLNNLISTNFQKEPKSFVLNRKGQRLEFQWFSYKIDEETEHYIISNFAYAKQPVANNHNLFDNNQEVETRHFLLQGLKKFHYYLLTLSKIEVQIIKPLQKKGIIQSFECQHLDNFKKTEQTVLQNIYYEKQS